MPNSFSVQPYTEVDYKAALRKMKGLIANSKTFAATLPEAAAVTFTSFVKSLVWVDKGH